MKLAVADAWAARYVRIFLDGEELPNCVSADDNTGIVNVLLREEGGFGKPNPIKPRSGKVTFQIVFQSVTYDLKRTDTGYDIQNTATGEIVRQIGDSKQQLAEFVNSRGR